MGCAPMSRSCAGVVSLKLRALAAWSGIRNGVPSGNIIMVMPEGREVIEGMGILEAPLGYWVPDVPPAAWPQPPA